MQTLHQSPTDPGFVQNPYPFYEAARQSGPFFHWADYGLTCTGNWAAVSAIFRDRRFGREVPGELAPVIPDHLRPFYAVEAHSMLELEPPRHTRLRSLVLRAFTTRRINALQPEIAHLSQQLIDAFPPGEFDLLKHFGQRLPVIIIARLLGVPETMSDDLLRWSNAMVGMYMAGRTRDTEDRAVAATEAFGRRIACGAGFAQAGSLGVLCVLGHAGAPFFFVAGAGVIRGLGQGAGAGQGGCHGAGRCQKCSAFHRDSLR